MLQLNKIKTYNQRGSKMQRTVLIPEKGGNGSAVARENIEEVKEVTLVIQGLVMNQRGAGTVI